MTYRPWMIAIIAALAACRGPAPDDTVCRCTPGNHSGAKQRDGTPFDGATLLGKLRRHRREVDQGKNPRDVKLLDDELRLELAAFCQPCSDWIGDRLTVEEMFPMERLDDAATAVCLGLVLRDGTTAYGAARPRACR